MNLRKRKASRRLCLNLTGNFGPKIQAFAIRQLRQWITEIPGGDSICMRCESALPDKQFRVWKRWFKTHEDPRWLISDEHKSFFFYKPKVIE